MNTPIPPLPATDSSMTTRLALDVLQVENPCPTDWQAMRGDGRSRFCEHCFTEPCLKAFRVCAWGG